jgi:hypothetical protein
MNVLSCKKYNKKQTLKWNEDWKAMMAKINTGERHLSELPQLAFYIFNKNYGYVAFKDNKALWDKSKAGVIAWWKDEERLKKIRGY